MVSLSHVLLRLFPVGGDELLHTSAQNLLHKHTVSPGFPGVEPLIYPPLYQMVCGDMLALLKYHNLKDNELLQVPLSVL